MLKLRIITACILVPLVFGALFVPAPYNPWLWMAAVTLFILGIGGWEWGRMAGLGKHSPMVGLAFAVIGLGVWFYAPAVLQSSVLHALTLLFWCVFVPVYLYRPFTIKHKAVLLLLGLLILLPAYFALLEWRTFGVLSTWINQPLKAGGAIIENLQNPMQGAWLVFILMSIVWVADSAAYFAGKAFGKHKLAPAISPGKSWEGAVGGVLGVVAYGAFLQTLPVVQQLHLGWHLLWVLALLAAISIYGDLLESWFKRCAGIKDSSQVFPGHGGVLDRTDALLALAAVANACLHFAIKWA